MSVPLHVVSNAAEANGVLRRWTRAGWSSRSGFAVTETTWDVSSKKLLCYGRVGDSQTAALAVLAAARGAGVVAVCDARTKLGASLAADLSRIGPLGTDPVGEADAAAPPAEAAGLPVTAEQAALLARLAEGQTIAAAAEAEYLSLRTANRRIAGARKALGVATTREAVLAFMKHQRQR